MRKKRNFIEIIIFLVIIAILCTTSNVSYADSFEINSLIEDNSYDPTNQEAPDGLAEFAGRILGTISIVGAILTVIIIAVIGFQYITGSSSEKMAELKSKLGIILIGVVMMTAATSIVRLVMFMI